MQRVCHIHGGVKHYLDDTEMLVSEATRICPFCSEPHRLWRYGWYHRYALFPDDVVKFIPVRRLYCRWTGRTVSLLPDFCIPKHQHGPAILALLLQAVLFRCTSLLAALQALRASAGCHTTALSLIGDFAGRDPELRTYLSQLFPRLPEPPASVPVQRRPLAELFLAITQGAADVVSAFLHHGRLFHERFALGIA